MYEPKRIPSLYAQTEPLPPMRYGIKKADSFIDLEDPTIDPLHIHDYLEIFFNTGAEVSFLVGDTVYPVAKGDIVISRGGEVHVCVFPRSDVYRYFCLWVDADFSSPLFSFLRKENFSPPVSPSEEQKKRIAALLTELCALQGQEKNELCELSLLLGLLCAVDEAHNEPKRPSPLPPRFAEIIRYINRSFAEIRTVSAVQEKFFISASALSRAFRTYLHTTPREYIEAQKLSAALELLKDGASVTEACAEAGFSDCSHFIVLFKKKFGQTPLRYKKRS